jgi:hypothetical protein
MKIGDKLWHPCSIDIIEHKIVAIYEFEDSRGKIFKHYTLKAVNNVGACGKIEVIIDEHNDKFRFVELVNEDTIPYASGLQDFVEGFYYKTKEEATIEFYNKQVYMAKDRIDRLERELKQANDRLNQIQSIIKIAKGEKDN